MGASLKLRAVTWLGPTHSWAPVKYNRWCSFNLIIWRFRYLTPQSVLFYKWSISRINMFQMSWGTGWCLDRPLLFFSNRQLTSDDEWIVIVELQVDEPLSCAVIAVLLNDWCMDVCVWVWWSTSYKKKQRPRLDQRVLDSTVSSPEIPEFRDSLRFTLCRATVCTRWFLQCHTGRQPRNLVLEAKWIRCWALVTEIYQDLPRHSLHPKTPFLKAISSSKTVLHVL